MIGALFFNLVQAMSKYEYIFFFSYQFLIVPSIIGSALLHRMSDDRWEKITAWIYGMGLCALFIVSTVFHIVTWKKSHLRYVPWCKKNHFTGMGKGGGCKGTLLPPKH